MGIHTGSDPKRKSFYKERFGKGLLLTYTTREPGGMAVTTSRYRRLMWASSLLVALLALGIEGCTFSRAQINAADLEQRVANVVPGTTRIEEVERMIGGPATSITPVGTDHLLYAWTFGDSKTAGLTLIFINIMKTNSGIDTALFLVDEGGVVEEAKIGQNHKEVGWQWWAFGD